MAAEHIEDVAAIHVEGQPGTFLTILGRRFLCALYAQMVTSPHCHGYVAVGESESRRGQHVQGVVVGTEDGQAIFKELILCHGLSLAWSVALAILHRPKLIVQVIQTLFYPGKIEAQPGEAELFFIGVRSDCRQQGIGQALFTRLAQTYRQMGMVSMGLTVDATNSTALRFYQRNGMFAVHEFNLYSRPMYWYRLPLKTEE